jgi:Mlc titration factor MtfA (ptsG expression regulator)
MLLGWLRRRRRKRVLEKPFPEAWRAILDRRVPMYGRLTADERAHLERIVQILVAEKHFEGCNGFEITDEVRVTIAGHAACLLLGNERDYYPRLRSIVVYPDIFVARGEFEAPDGTVVYDADERAGESWDLGAVVLAWDEVLQSGRNLGDGYNVVLHEFAHQLDQSDREADGTPILKDPALRERWAEVMQADYDALHRDLDEGRATVLDPYAAEDPAEFFAVASETFFESPKRLKRKHPELYALLSGFYRQDPASRLN